MDRLARLLAADPDTIDEESRTRYATAYNQPSAVRAANGWYQALRNDAADSRTHPTITAPLLMLSAQGTAPFFMSALGEAVFAPTFVTIPGAGHCLGEERPTDFARIVTDFLT
ncbi:alpha/beta fold hydrolase [Streptomyces sp. NPDC055025]